MPKNKRGGKRKGAGRKELPDKERGFRLSLWIKPIWVNYDKPNKVRKYLYDRIEEYN